MNTRDLLIEIGTEELPPKALANLSTALELSLTEQLQALELSFGNVERFASPRRLAVLIEGLDEAQEDQERTRLGPAIRAAFDERFEFNRKPNNTVFRIPRSIQRLPL